jgi:hypothetical protein
VWSGTVIGTAAHLAQADRYSGKPLRKAREYWDDAVAAEARDGRQIRFFKDGSKAQADAVDAAESLGWTLNEWCHDNAAQKLAARLEVCDRLDPHIRRLGDVVAVERQFIVQDPDTGEIYEGTIDLLTAGPVVDWKFGGRSPADPADTDQPAAWTTSPQPHVYMLAVQHGWFAEAPNLPGLHQIDWPNRTTEFVRYGVWPSAFLFAHIQSMKWDDAGNLISGLVPVVSAEPWSWAYVRELTARWREAFPDEARGSKRQSTSAS